MVEVGTTQNTESKPQVIGHALCVEPRPEGSDLLPGRVYAVVAPEPTDDSSVELRIIDEEGEDYLYPAKWFMPIELSEEAARQLARVMAATHEAA